MTETPGANASQRPTLRRRLVKVGAVTLITVLACAVAELGARALADFELVGGEIVFLESHSESGQVRLEEHNGTALWFRDYAGRVEPAADKHGYRVIVLGDSVLAPAGVPSADGAVARVRELVAPRATSPVEVINLAQSGWNTLQEEQELLRRGLGLEPDLVLVGVTPNDTQAFVLRNNQLQRADFHHAASQRPTSGLTGWLAANSYLFNSLWLLGQDPTPEQPSLESMDHLERTLVLEPLKRMHAAAADAGARFGIICFPRKPRAPEAEETEAAEAAVHFEPAHESCTFRHVAKWASEAGVPLLDPIPVYARYPMAGFWMDHIHLSAFGHSVLAAATYRWLVEHALVPVPAASRDDVPLPAPLGS